MKPHAQSGRDRRKIMGAVAAVAALWAGLGVVGARADTVLYLQTFGDATAGASTFAAFNGTIGSGTGWSLLTSGGISNGGSANGNVADATATAGVVNNLAGQGGTGGNVGAAAGTAASATLGLVAFSSTINIKNLAYTAVTIDPTASADLSFQWYAGDNMSGGPNTQAVALQIGGSWYVSTAITPPSVPSATGFPASAVQETVDMNTSQWFALTASIGSPFALSSTATALPTGDITAFGIYDVNFGNSRFDSFSVTAVAAPEPSTVALMGLGALGLLAAMRRRFSW